MNSERLYLFLLNGYPRRYLEQYKEPMVQCFQDQLRDADTFGKRLRLWLHTFGDLAVSVPARYLDGRLRGLLSHFDYSEGAKRAIFFAVYVGTLSDATEITIEHLLLGVLREDRNLANAIVGRHGYDAIARAIAGPVAETRRVRLAHLPLREECKKALANAGDRARLAQQKVNSRHLLAAIVEQPETRAAGLLRDHAVVDLSQIGDSSAS